ncbi:MAG: tetratricopeptide repeat protein [Pseudomonadota bacterium]|nr:tetratricopeptide repeat protein [Pseudomonadota bacterium]
MHKNQDQIKAAPWVESGNHFCNEEKWAEATNCLLHALKIDPYNPATHAFIATIYKHQQMIEQAQSSYQRAHDLAPENPDYLYNLALFHQETGNLPPAKTLYLTLLNKHPDHADANANLGLLYQDMNQTELARHYYEQDLKLRPDDADSHFNLALINLLTGNYEVGWHEYEWRFKRDVAKRTYPHTYKQPRWQGKSFSGKTLFIHGEQGFGDNLQFLRYLPLVKELGGKVILETHRPLAPLIKDFPGIDKLLIYNPEQPAETTFDYYAPLLSLPGIFKTTTSSIPAQTPLLKAPTQLCENWSLRLTSPRIKVALVWSGNTLRSCSAENFLPLCELVGFDFYGLQTGPPTKESQVLHKCSGFQQNLGPELNSFADTAAIISQLDLIITIDTATAHLAGAMGHKVWVLLPFAPDWRWFLERSDSPWYPNMRLFRQPEPGNWQPVISLIKSELEQFGHHNLLEKLNKEC